ncbi:MAG: hypothetical protein EXX96DRAFT_577197 [Benjaminiella poitrasii]|nr:MAG: hypothetical protein EXX96DRAFT_577197 [Benjaminiella poitrasii]
MENSIVNENEMISTCWKSFKEKRTNPELYSDNTVIIYQPTLVGTRGDGAQIRKFFLHRQFSEKVNSVQETVYNTVACGHKLIEEVVWTVRFHSTECKWLLPHLEDSFMLNTTVQFPVTVSVAFDTTSHKIESIRYLWDQACVLKQLRVISDRFKWPVVGEKQVEALTVPHKIQLTGLNDEVIDADYKKVLQDQEKNQPSSGRTDQPTPQKAPTSRNIFTYQPPPQRPMVAPSNKLDSTFKFTHSDGSSPPQNNKTTVINNNNTAAMPPAGKRTPHITRNIII